MTVKNRCSCYFCPTLVSAVEHRPVTPPRRVPRFLFRLRNSARLSSRHNAADNSSRVVAYAWDANGLRYGSPTVVQFCDAARIILNIIVYCYRFFAHNDTGPCVRRAIPVCASTLATCKIRASNNLPARCRALACRQSSPPHVKYYYYALPANNSRAADIESSRRALETRTPPPPPPHRGRDDVIRLAQKLSRSPPAYDIVKRRPRVKTVTTTFPYDYRVSEICAGGT